MFLSVDLSVYYEEFLVVVFSATPFMILAFFNFILSHVLKNKRLKKYNNAVVAKIIKVEEAEDLRGRVLIYLEYMYNGRLMTEIYKSFVKYHVGSEVRIILYGDKPGEIISDVPSDVSESETALNLHLDQLFSFFGYFFIVFSIFGVFANLEDNTGEPIFISLIIVFSYVLVIYVLYGLKKKYNLELDLLNSNKYELIKAKVIDYKLGYKLFNFKPIQFPVVEFLVDGNKMNRLLKEDVIINSGNEKETGTLMVFRNRETGKILSESELKNKIDIINTIMVISTIVSIFILCVF